MAFLLLAILAVVTGERVVHKPVGGSDESRFHGRSFRVVKVVDGDTMDLDIVDGDKPTTRVRLWGVDTPEVAHGGEPAMHYGAEAKTFAERTLAGGEVRVVLNSARTRDKYDRLLAYLVLDGGDLINERLISEGFGYADWRFDHPYKDEFEVAERRAQRAGVGLWKELRAEQMPAWRQRMSAEKSNR